MIIVDTSVWVDYFNGVSTTESDYLDSILGIEMVGLGDLIAVEILQGFRYEADFESAKILLQSLPIDSFLGPERAVNCAQNYRRLRLKGITIQKTTDVIIASYCISEGHKLLFSDKDFVPFVQHLGLRPAI
ncbi:MAG: PIN domain nuclease [Bacteroidetes bacterium]|nr:PIN domain nuclease [Bacteroidota bacterium]